MSKSKIFIYILTFVILAQASYFVWLVSENKDLLDRADQLVITSSEFRDQTNLIEKPVSQSKFKADQSLADKTIIREVKINQEAVKMVPFKFQEESLAPKVELAVEKNDLLIDRSSSELASSNSVKLSKKEKELTFARQLEQQLKSVNQVLIKKQTQDQVKQASYQGLPTVDLLSENQTKPPKSKVEAVNKTKLAPSKKYSKAEIVKFMVAQNFDKQIDVTRRLLEKNHQVLESNFKIAGGRALSGEAAQTKSLLENSRRKQHSLVAPPVLKGVVLGAQVERPTGEPLADDELASDLAKASEPVVGWPLVWRFLEKVAPYLLLVLLVLSGGHFLFKLKDKK